MATESTSIIRIFDVLVVTFPSNPLDQVVDELQEELLQSMDDVQPRGVVIDIANVTTLDSFFARVIAETADMVGLMGGEAIVVGMRPSVAITASELGYEFEDIETARNTDHALSLLGVHAAHEERSDE